MFAPRLLALFALSLIAAAYTGCKESKQPAPKPKKKQIAEFNRKIHTIDRVLAAWTDDWTLRVYAVKNCPEFACGVHLDRNGRLTKRFRRECASFEVYGVEFRASRGVRMQTGKWRHMEKNPRVHARPLIINRRTLSSGLLFARGGWIELVSLSDKKVRVNANFKDANGATYGAGFWASVCPWSRKPAALTSKVVEPAPWKPLLNKARLLSLKPTLPTDASDYEWRSLMPRDGHLIWKLIHKTTRKEAATVRIHDVRNKLYSRSKRSKRCLGRFPCLHHANAWIWLYVGNFNIDISATAVGDKRFKNDAGLQKLLQALPLTTFEKL